MLISGIYEGCNVRKEIGTKEFSIADINYQLYTAIRREKMIYKITMQNLRGLSQFMDEF